MPEQITRLLIFFLLILLAYFVVRPALIPASYGLYGRYRAGALNEIREYEGPHVGTAACAECHDDVAASLADSRHGRINCESCHGPGGPHVEDPTSQALFRPTEEETRQFCGLCHHARVARPPEFPQVDIEAHNVGMPCTFCHDPHAVESMRP